MLYKIIDYLYLSDSKEARDSPDYHHVNCTKDIPRYNTKIFDFYRVPADDNGLDGTAFLNALPGAVEFIRDKLERKENVIVHCFAGQQRSCAVIAAYLMAHYKEYGSNIDEIVNFIKSKKSDAFIRRVKFFHEISLWKEALLHNDLNSVITV
jgi:dual specificity MAP kinase phosphatase